MKTAGSPALSCRKLSGLMMGILLIILLFPVFQVYGQAAAAALEKQLEGTQGAERVRILNTLSETLIEQEPDKSLSYAQEALPLADQLKLESAAADSLNHIGYALFRKGESQEAVKTFQTAISRSQAAGYSKGIGMGRNGYGLVWLSLNEYANALNDFETAIRFFKEADYPQGEAYALANIGTAHQASGAYDKALEAYLQALRIDESLNNRDEMATVYNNIGTVNARQNNFEAAYDYYSKALEIYEADGNAIGRADTFMNLGGFFQDFSYFAEAEDFFTQALKLTETMDSPSRVALALNALGYLKELQEDYTKALDNYAQALDLGQRIDDQEIRINAWNNIGTVHHKNGRYEDALAQHILAFEASKAITYEPGLESSLKNIANDYQAMGNFQDANHYFILYNELRDALNEREQARSLANSQTLYETEKKDQQIAQQQADIAAKEKRTRILLGIMAAVLLFLGVTATQAYLIAKEKRKSEALLLNILPAKVADDLKRNGRTEPERFDDVTILFSDIVGFTSISSTMDPHVLVGELNAIFTAFDAIMDTHNCQRIKTIGDAYFALCGLPDPHPDHAANIVNAARDMLAYLKERNHNAAQPWQIRVGVHTGPVVGGVVGVKKYIYDVFGDTVNTASRMESNGEPMRINVSEATRTLLEGRFAFEEREPLPVKGKGTVKMYFVG